MAERLDTEELLYSCRTNYNANVHTRELETMKQVLAVKEKEVYVLSQEIISLKESYSQRVLVLEKELNDLKTANNEQKFLTVRNRRLQNEKHDKVIQDNQIRHQAELKAKCSHYEDMISELKAASKQELERATAKYEQIIRMEKQQSKVLTGMLGQRELAEDSSQQSYQQEKIAFVLERNSYQKELETYRKAVEQLKNQFQLYIYENSTSSTQMQRNLADCQANEQLLRENIRQLEARLYSKSLDMELRHTDSQKDNHQLRKDKERLIELLQQKDTEIFQLHARTALAHEINSKQEMESFAEPAVRPCNHLGLINELERNIDMKEREIDSLRLKMDEWKQIVQFDVPMKDRLQDVSDMYKNVSQANANFVKSIRSQASSKKPNSNNSTRKQA